MLEWRPGQTSGMFAYRTPLGKSRKEVVRERNEVKDYDLFPETKDGKCKWCNRGLGEIHRQDCPAFYDIPPIPIRAASPYSWVNDGFV